MKSIKRFFIIFLTIFLVIIMTTNIYALQSLDGVLEDMKGVKDVDSTLSSSSGVGAVLNDAIGLLQLAGTGISVITVTLLGIKYMLTSVEQRAEIKNKAVPIVIGCIILFGAVNIVAIIADFTNTALE